MKTIPGYLTKNEAARTLGITRRTLDRHIQKHKIPTFRFVGDPTIYVLEEDIKKLFSPIRKAN
jgi:bacterial regulatory protein, fis family|nr:MAG TPA: helix-turn-helix domain protein [Caudoviricetes sp.]